MKKLNNVDQMEMKKTLNFLIRVTKPVTRLDMKKEGLLGNRKVLRALEKQGKITKIEKFAKNTYKMGMDGKTLQGTKYYMYSALR